jgi:NAD(P)-dependent dehydrogenase (short-subunit alcohol dehydrogenase family)
VDVLVNNAGYALTGAYREVEWSAQSRFLQVMVTAYAELAHRLLPWMVEQRWGRIVNVASVAGLLPGAPGDVGRKNSGSQTSLPPAGDPNIVRRWNPIRRRWR